MNRVQDLLRSPEFYPLRVDFERREIAFVRMSRETYRDSVFLDTRTRHLGPAYTLRLDDVILATSSLPGSSLPVTYILHPAFCCSTLLSRYFELLASCFVLREPLLLTQVALAAPDPGPQWPELFDGSVKLLTRGYEDTEWVVIKAHEPCNILGRKLLQGDATATVIFLTTPLRHFVLSVLKSNERRLWIRSRVCGALTNGVAESSLDDIRPSSLTDAQAAACLWSINNALRQELSEAPERSRVFLLDSDELVDRPEETLRAIARACRRPLDEKDIAGMVEHPSMRKYSKNVSLPYDADSRRREMKQLEDRFGAEADAGAEWATRHAISAVATA